jgi:hypothetical protein
MNINERCLYESMAQNLVGDAVKVYPVECPVKKECLASKENICLRIIQGESSDEITDDLAISAFQTRAIVTSLFKK